MVSACGHHGAGETLRSQKPEARSQKPEARSQKPEARSQKPEARSQKPEARSQKPEARSQKPEARSQKPEARPARDCLLGSDRSYRTCSGSRTSAEEAPKSLTPVRDRFGAVERRQKMPGL